MAKKFSLFIQDTNIRFLLANRGRIEKWSVLPLEAGIVSDGVVQEEEKLASLLKAHLKLLKITDKEVILCLSGLNSFYRLIDLPQLPDNVLSEAIMHEAERVMPVMVSEVYLSYQPIPGAVEGRHIFLAAFPRAATDSLVQAVRKAGLQPSQMDLTPLALSRVVDLPRAVVVNVLGTQMDIIVMVDRVPQVIRSLQLSGETQNSSDKLAAIAEEIERTIAFYNANQQEKQLDASVPVSVCGDLAEPGNNLASLSEKLGHPVSIIPSPMEAPEGFMPCQFMVNIGLSLKGISQDKGITDTSMIDFNALPEAYRIKKMSPVNVVVPVVIVVVLCLNAVMYYMITNVSAHVEALGDEIAAIEKHTESQQTEITTLMANLDKLTNDLKPIEEKANIFDSKLQGLKAGRARIDDDTYQIVNRLPETLGLITIGYAESGIITIKGEGTDKYEIYAYATSLRATSRFAVTIVTLQDEITETGDEPTVEIKEVKYTFTLSLEAINTQVATVSGQ